jgi:chaperonin cofactor prefoldin
LFAISRAGGSFVRITGKYPRVNIFKNRVLRFLIHALEKSPKSSYTVVMAKKSVTIDDLAGMVQRGFVDLEKRIDGRFDSVDKRIDGVDKRMDGLEEKIDGLDKDMKSGFAGVSQRLDALEARMSSMERHMESIEETLVEVVDRLGRVEQLVDEDHQTRIKRLEDGLQKMQDSLAMKNS